MVTRTIKTIFLAKIPSMSPDLSNFMMNCDLLKLWPFMTFETVWTTKSTFRKWFKVTFSNCDLVRLPDFSPSSDRSGLNRFFNGFSYLGTKKTTVQHFLQTSRCITINFILWFEYVLSKYLLMMLEVSKHFCTMVFFSGAKGR